MKKIIVVTLLFVVIPSIAYSQAMATTYSIKENLAQIWLTDQGPCNYIILTVERIEELNKPIKTMLGYQVKNCDGTNFAYQDLTEINNAGFTVNSQNKVYKLNVSSPTNISITWQFPLKWREINENLTRKEQGGKINQTKNNSEILGVVATGSIGGKLILNNINASVTFSNFVTSESK